MNPSSPQPFVRVAHPLKFPRGGGAGQRSADRRDVTVLAEIRELGADDAPLPLELSEVSATGAFVASDLLLPVGARVAVRFGITGLGEAIETEGRVVRVQHRGGQPGMGLIFERMHADARARLRAFTAWN